MKPARQAEAWEAKSTHLDFGTAPRRPPLRARSAVLQNSKDAAAVVTIALSPAALSPPQMPRAAPPEPPKRRLLDQVRDAIRARHYSYRTEETYVSPDPCARQRCDAA